MTSHAAPRSGHRVCVRSPCSRRRRKRKLQGVSLANVHAAARCVALARESTSSSDVERRLVFGRQRLHSDFAAFHPRVRTLPAVLQRRRRRRLGAHLSPIIAHVLSFSTSYRLVSVRKYILTPSFVCLPLSCILCVRSRLYFFEERIHLSAFSLTSKPDVNLCRYFSVRINELRSAKYARESRCSLVQPLSYPHDHMQGIPSLLRASPSLCSFVGVLECWERVACSTCVC